MLQVSRSIVLGVVAELRGRGFTRAQLLQEAGLSASELEQANVPFHVAAQAIGAAYRLTGDQAFALRLGTRAPTHMLDVFGELLMHCDTPRAAIRELERYEALLTPGSHFRLVEEGSHARLIQHTTFGDPGVTRVVVELTMAVVARIGWHFVGDAARPVAMRFAYEAPEHAHAYGETFGCPIYFDQSTTEALFHRAILDEEQPFGDEPLRSLLKNRADELLNRRVEQRGLFARVIDVLEQQRELANVKMGVIARRLGMSESRLRRQLREEQTSWTCALDVARREMAVRALKNPEIPIKEIAEQTGFSEVSAFHRAFRRWTGSTPAKFRADGSGADEPRAATAESETETHDAPE